MHSSTAKSCKGVITLANEITYSTSSILNIFTTNPSGYSGSYTQSASSLVLGPSSAVTFSLSFNTSSNPLNSESLQLQIVLGTENVSLSSLYSSDVSVSISVEYFDETTDANGTVTSYVDGPTDLLTFFPFYSFETSTQGYSSSFTSSLKGLYIKSIAVTFYNKLSSSITIRRFLLQNSQTLSQAVTNTLSFDVAINSITWHPNAFTLDYTGAEQLVLYWNGDAATDSLNGINVGGKRLIRFNDSQEWKD